LLLPGDISILANLTKTFLVDEIIIVTINGSSDIAKNLTGV
jgi:hypothetical protein